MIGISFHIDDLAPLCGDNEAAAYSAVRTDRCGFRRVPGFECMSVSGRRFQVEPELREKPADNCSARGTKEPSP